MCGALLRERVFDHNQTQVGMIAAQLVEKTLGRVAFAVVFRLAVLFDDRLGHQGNHFLEVGMHDRRSQHLMIIGDLSVLAGFLHTGRTVDFVRGKIPGAIQRQQITSFVEDERLQGLAALQLAKHILEQGAE